MNTKRVSKSGGISIPVGLRREHALDVETDAQGNVVLKRHLPRCVFCGSTENVNIFMGKGICRACAGQIGKEDV